MKSPDEEGAFPGGFAHARTVRLVAFGVGALVCWLHPATLLAASEKDTQPPTAPGNLKATVIGSQITLMWTASTDNVRVTGYRAERCQGVGCTTFVQIGAPTTRNTFSDTGLGAGTYGYRVCATDRAGNLSSYSNTAIGVILDTRPPTAPTDLTATRVSPSQIRLTWTASNDDIGITGYLLEQCQGTGCTTFAQIAVLRTTTYNDSGLATNSSYSYRVRASDGGNNLSPYSTIATVPAPVTAIPTAPTNLSASNGGQSPIVVATQSYINSTFLTSHTAAAFDSTGGDLIVICSSSHAGVTFLPSDSFGNSWISIAGPTNTSVGFDLRTQIWYARDPIVGPGHTVTMDLSAAQSLVISIIVVNGSNISSPIDAVSPIGSDSGTGAEGVVSPGIVTEDTNDLLIGFVKVSAGATFRSGAGFTQQSGASSHFLDAEAGTAAVPGTYNATFTLDSSETWQSAVVAVANNPNQATLSWTASTETGGRIRSYLVERCRGAVCGNFAQIGMTTRTTFNDMDLTASASYSYRVRTEDTADTVGPYSNVSTVTTPAATPSAPGNLTAADISSTEIDLSWMASAETGGTISNYLVERCQGAGCSSFAQIGTTTGTAFRDTTLAASTSYTYRVRATDLDAKPSPYSNWAIAITTGLSPTRRPKL